MQDLELQSQLIFQKGNKCHDSECRMKQVDFFLPSRPRALSILRNSQFILSVQYFAASKLSGYKYVNYCGEVCRSHRGKAPFSGREGREYLRDVLVQGPQEYPYSTTQKYRDRLLQSWWKCCVGRQ